MKLDESIVETRGITSEEAEICANEQVQYIGNVQPHGFVLVVDGNDHKIVQHSANLLEHINQTQPSPLPQDTPIIGTPLSDWIELSANPLTNLVRGSSQIFSFGEVGRISAIDWECLAFYVSKGRFICLEFFPTTAKFDSYSLLINLDRMVTRIRASNALPELFKVLTDEFRQHAEYDRVMLYRFLPDWSGEVVAESVSERASVQFLGMRFPAEDIPRAARELYKTSTIRIMADVDAEPSPLVPERLPDGEPLDQSYSVLRGMSKMHIAYLKNMGVKASMSISLMSKGKLWGLVALHNYSAKVPPNHLVTEMKASCELFADIVISHLNPALDLDTIQRSVERKHRVEDAFRCLKDIGHDIDGVGVALDAVRPAIDKDFIGVCLEERCFVASEDGLVQPHQRLYERLMALVTEGSEHNSYESCSLLENEGHGALPGLPHVAGILVQRSLHIPELLVFFGAKEVEKHIVWGGKPGTVNIVIKDGARKLVPRSSFALWRQQVFGHSDEWKEEDRELLGAFMMSVEQYVLHSKNEQFKVTLHQSSYNDALTGLPNRRYLQEYIQNLACHTEQTTLLTVFFLDLDEFKRINDFMGHQAGDRLLQVVADRLKRSVRPDDLVARLGGDEFVLVVKNTSEDVVRNEIMAHGVAEKIIASVAQPIFDEGQPMVTTASVGAVICNPCELSYDEILKRADIAMYRAKHSGKNQVHFFSLSDQDEVNQQVKLELALRDCLDRGQLQLYFQPKVSRSGKVKGAEALARWYHEELGYIRPDVFIPLAEKSNLISVLGEQVLDKACAQLAQWQADTLLEDFNCLAVNVSPAQILEEGFEQRVKEIISRHGLAPEMIRLEITETLFMQNFDAACSILQSLRDAGITVSLDDFGTGYSSLSYLWKLPIDEVKIDRSFIKNMHNSEESLSMVEGIIELCKKMKLEIVAEGVEEKVQIALLRGLNCDTLQGYYYQRPVSPEEMLFRIDAQ